MRKAVYPGSFDPLTNGHIDIIRRVAPLFDELIILVSRSHKKTYLFSDEERLALVQESLVGLENVNVQLFDGLTVDFAEKMQAAVIIRGIRAVADFEYEMAIAHMNKKLNPNLETMVIMSSPEATCISSRMVKEIASYGGSLEELAPPHVVTALNKHFNRN